MSAPSFDIRDMLMNEASSSEELFGLIFGENLFIGREPANPSNCVTIFDTAGANPVLTLSKEEYEYTSVQIRIRDTSYENGWVRSEKIASILQGRAHEVWGDYYYSLISIANGPFHYDWDENKRVRFIINVNIQRRKNNE